MACSEEELQLKEWLLAAIDNGTVIWPVETPAISITSDLRPTRDSEVLAVLPTCVMVGKSVTSNRLPQV